MSLKKNSISCLDSLLFISPQCVGWLWLLVNCTETTSCVRCDRRRSAKQVSNSCGWGKSLDSTRAWYSMKCLTHCRGKQVGSVGRGGRSTVSVCIHNLPKLSYPPVSTVNPLPQHTHMYTPTPTSNPDFDHDKTNIETPTNRHIHTWIPNTHT